MAEVSALDQTISARRRQTRSSIYRYLYEAGVPCSKQQIAAALGLSLPTVYQNLTELAAAGGRVTGVKTEAGPIPADCVILATGGLSYPTTGSTGDGYRLAAALGHTIVEPVGSLVPLVEKGHDCAKMQGLALKNIAVRLVNAKGKTVYEDFG